MNQPALPRRESELEAGPHRSELIERTVHDIKNPLAVVRSALEWLEVELEGRADALDAIRDATTAATRLLTIVDDLDALARLERAGAIVRDAMEVTELVRRVAVTAAERLAARGLTVASTTPVQISSSGDADLLERSLHALIDACARGAPAGTCIEIRAGLAGAERCAAGIEIEIEIGQQGTTPSAPETSSLEGLASGGLGVYVALQVARAHGGSLVVIPTATMPHALMRLPR
jgi:K+-sensing histidine kinase KdpD